MVNESNALDLSQMICHNLLGNEMKKIMIIYIPYPNWIPKIMGVLQINIVKEHIETITSICYVSEGLTFIMQTMRV